MRERRRVDGRDIGRRKTPVFRRAMPGHDDFWLSRVR
jgi:hypothetical protein